MLFWQKKSQLFFLSILLLAAFFVVEIKKVEAAFDPAVTYSKTSNGQLSADEWNNLQNDFVRAWGSTTAVGGIGIGIAPQGTDLNGLVASSTIKTNLAFLGTLNSTYVSAGTFGTMTGGGNYIFPANLGIGATSTSARLQITGSGTFDSIFRLTNTGTSGGDYFMGVTNSDWNAGGNKLVFGAGVPLSTNIKMVMGANGNVGIGTTNPNEQLEITKNFRLPATSGTTPYGIIYKNGNRFIHDFNYGLNGNGITTTGNNTFVGLNAGNFTMGSTATTASQASYNTGIGYASLYANTTGSQNTANGYFSLRSNTTGSNNTANGYASLRSNTTGSNNTAIGAYALYSNTTGSNNSAIGLYAGFYLADGTTGRSTGNNGLYLGYNSKASADGTNNEIVIGYNAIGKGSNTATYGNDSMLKHIFEAGNVGIGSTTPNFKFVVNGDASFSGYQIHNVGAPATGTDAANRNYVDTLMASTSAGIITQIATSSLWQGSLTGAIYNNNSGNVGIGTSTPSEKLEVVGKLKIGNNTISGESFTFEEDTSFGMKVANPNGYIRITPGNSSWAHIYTDRGAFIFNKPVWTIAGAFSSYTNKNLLLQTAGTTRITVDYANGNVGIGTTTPGSLLTVGNNLGLTALGTIYGATSTRYLDLSGVLPNALSAPGDIYSTAGVLKADGAGTSYVMGKFGVKTTNPGGNLSVDVGSSSDMRSNGLLVEESGAKVAAIGDGGASGSQYGYLGLYSTGDVERVRLYAYGNNWIAPSNGNVGIGTTNPIANLDVQGLNKALGAAATQSGNLRIATTDEMGQNIGGSLVLGGRYITGNPAIIAYGTISGRKETAGSGNNAGYLAFETADNSVSPYTIERMRINGSGKVGIGTTAPGYKLDVAGEANFNGNQIHGVSAPTQATDAANKSYVDSSITPPATTTAGIQAGFWTTGAAGSIYNNNSSGKVGIGTTNPGSMLTVGGADDKDAGPILNLSGSSVNQFESGRVRFTETTVAASPFYQGAFFHYDGSNNIFNIGVHETANALQASDINSIRITRSNGNVNIGNGALFAQYNGNVGVGTVTPGVKFVNSGASLAWYPTLGSGIVGANAILSQNGLYGLYTGVSTNGDVWQQVQRNDTNTAVYRLLLNPLGGNVGINTTAPTQKLHVAGDASFLVGTSSPSQVHDVAAPTQGTDVANRNYVDSNFAPIAIVGSASLWATSTAGTYNVGLGNVGIGTTAPNEQLEITKNFRLPATSGTTPYGIIYKDGNRFIHDFNYGLNGNGITPTGRNTFIGINAGNFTMGSTATDASEASYNTGIGYQSLRSNTTGSSNTANGYYSLSSNTTGSNNTANGFNSLYSNTTGSQNTANGASSLSSNTTGSNNTAIGFYSLLYNTTGSNNTANGINSLRSNTTGSYNTALGRDAGRYIANGTTGRSTGNNGLYLGYNSMASADGTTNEIVIGYNAIGKGSSTATYGNSSMLKHIFEAGNVGIGTTGPGYKLDVAGDLNLNTYQIHNLGAPVTGTDAVNRNYVDTLISDSVSATDFWKLNGSNLYSSSTAWNVGIGTTNPDEKLEIRASAINTNPFKISGSSNEQRGMSIGFTGDTENVIVFNRLISDIPEIFMGVSRTNGGSLYFPTGNVGIGTTNPTGKFVIKQSGGNWTDGLNIERSATTDKFNFTHDTAGRLLVGYNSVKALGIFSSGISVGSYAATTPPSDGMIIPGNVGIATTTPQVTLDVNGLIKMRASNITTTSDVINKGYLDSALEAYGSSNNFWKLNGSNLYASSTAWNVGIGVTNPTQKLDVAGNILANNHYAPTIEGFKMNGSLSNVVITTDTTQVAQTPIAGFLWHDILAFNRTGTPTFETSVDGTTWSSAPLDNRLFSQREAQSITILDASVTKAVRWTWSSGISCSLAQWLVLAYAYSSPAINQTVSIDTSTDGSTWSNKHLSTFNGTFRPYWLSLNPPEACDGNFFRVTITSNSSTGLMNMSSMRLLTSRWGNQGGGSEYSYPYNWDSDRNVFFDRKVGIGTTNPLNRLTISADSDGDGLIIKRNSAGAGTYADLGFTMTTTDIAPATYLRAYRRTSYSDNDLLFHVGASDAMYIKSNGNVGIGTTSPQVTLDVNGLIKMRASNITTTSDVINKGYLDSALEAYGSSNNFWKLNGSNLYSSSTAWNVGIGTTAPLKRLDVSGNFRMKDSSYSSAILSSLTSSPDFGAALYLGNAIGDGSNQTGIRLRATYGGVGTSGKPNFAIDRATNTQSYNGDISTLTYVNSLTIDGGNGNVGIGTSSPEVKLDVIGGNLRVGSAGAGQSLTVNGNSGTTATIFLNSASKSYGIYQVGTQDNYLQGDLGIGTTTPTHKLHVAGDASFMVGTSSPSQIHYVAAPTQGTDAVNRNYVDSNFIASTSLATITNAFVQGGNSFGVKAILGTNDNQALGIKTNNTERLTILANGNVGIGTTAPNNKLHIAGDSTTNGGSITLSNANNTNTAYNQILFQSVGSNDVTLRDVASIKTLYNDHGGNNPSGDLIFSTKNLAGILNENFIITSEGSVGIGTTTPITPLNVIGKWQYNNAGAIYSQDNSYSLDLAGINVDSLKVYKDLYSTTGVLKTAGTGNNWMMGNLGLGTSTPTEKLTINGNIDLPSYNNWRYIKNSAANGGLRLGTGNSSGVYTNGIEISSGGGYIKLNHNTTITGNLYASGNVGIGVTAPDSSLSVKSAGNAVTNIYGVSATLDYGAIQVSNVGGLTNPSSRPLVLQPNAGNVGIGTTTPSTKLYVNGVVTATGGFSGPLTGTVNAANISKGIFGANTGQGTYSFGGTTISGDAHFQWNGATYRNPGTYTPQINIRQDNASTGINSFQPALSLYNNNGSLDSTIGLDFVSREAAGAGNAVALAGIMAIKESVGTDNGWSQGGLLFYTKNFGERIDALRILNNGNVGIGTTTPGAFKLKVDGNVAITGTLQTMTGSDFAEEFTVSSPLEAGTVVVMGDLGYKSVKACGEKFDSTVVGVVSDNPSIIAGRVDSKHKVVVAMAGVVKVKVSNANGNIKKGTMLTTSNISGYAMKADNAHPGTIIGKALENLSGKQGEIKVLINLQ